MRSRSALSRGHPGKIRGYPRKGPPSKNAPAAILRARFFGAKPKTRRKPTASRSLATALWGRARSRLAHFGVSFGSQLTGLSTALDAGQGD
jgi:hypothetical protein